MLAPSAIVVFVVAAAGLGSLATLFWLFQKHIDGQPLLRHEPRRPVPWNFLAPLALLAPLVGLWLARPVAPALEHTADHAEVTAAAAVAASAGAPSAAAFGYTLHAAAVEYTNRRGNETAQVFAIWGQASASLALTAACLMMLSVAFRATREDLGLPANWSELRTDVATGALACLAALVPIYCIQYLLTVLLEPDRVHPLIEELEVNHSPQMMAAAAVAAVIAAPVFEETAFRLTLQGWLERAEAMTIAAYRSRPLGGDFLRAVEPVEPHRLPGVLPGLPQGWAPVLVSALLFAAAHAGHGVAPASLVVLGVVLGYLYLRTHRIVPSIVCHTCFNGLSIGVLWLELLTTGG